MRRTLLASVLVTAALAQQTTIRTTVPLVTVPVAVTDANGEPIDGLKPEDFVLLDEGKPRPVHVDMIDYGLAPVALVALVETSDMSLAALKKIDKVGAMIPLAVVGEGGTTAVLTYNSEVTVVQDFTKEAAPVAAAFEQLKPSDAHQGRLLDALNKALDILAAQTTASRANILIIGEARDRGSKTKLNDVIAKVQRTGATVYTMSYSKLMTPFTMKADDYEPGGASGLFGLDELGRLAKRNAFQALTEATGGQQLRFEVKSKLEADLMRVGKDIHNRYLLSFTPESGAESQFHHLEIRIQNHPNATVRARPGYWSNPVTTP